MTFETIVIRVEDNVGILTLNRPEAMNALNQQMMREVKTVIGSWEENPDVRAIILTGSEKSFAAGADIKEMLDVEFLDALEQNFLDDWTCIAKCRTPTIAAVAGYALGGGCEIAMMCDFIICADNAQFGQPEIRIGTLPGLGGTQRLTRLVGKAKAMDMCITGRMMKADEAERAGLVARVVPLADLEGEVLGVAKTIAGYSASAILLAREAVEAANNTTLEQGLSIERHSFYALFGTEDQKEGMRAFSEKRPPEFAR
ncbi:MAG: enoyl-CoA hydratase-related protein [Granulosicoccus sp.]